MKEPIGKVSESLQLLLEVPVAIEKVSALRRAFTGWSSLRNKLFITLFEQKKHLTQLLSDFIGDFKYEM